MEFQEWNTPNRILRLSTFKTLYDIYFKDTKWNMSEMLNEKKFRLKSIDFSYRIINHWQKTGLLIDNRADGKGWRKFSYIDLIWLHLLSELRSFGVSIKTLQKIRHNLYIDRASIPYSKFPYLEFYSAYALSVKIPIFGLFFNDGSAEILFDFEYLQTDQIVGLPNHIKINLNGICQKVFPKQDLTPVGIEDFAVSDEELNLLLILRTGEFSEITVILKDGKIVRFNKKKQISDNDVHKLLKEKQYDEIEIIRENGTVVSIKQTVKEKT